MTKSLPACAAPYGYSPVYKHVHAWHKRLHFGDETEHECG